MPAPLADADAVSHGKYVPDAMVSVCTGTSGAMVSGSRSMRGRYSTFLACCVSVLRRVVSSPGTSSRPPMKSISTYQHPPWGATVQSATGGSWSVQSRWYVTPVRFMPQLSWMNGVLTERASWRRTLGACITLTAPSVGLPNSDCASASASALTSVVWASVLARVLDSKRVASSRRASVVSPMVTGSTEYVV